MLEFKGGLVLHVPDGARVIHSPSGGVRLQFSNFTGEMRLLPPPRTPLVEVKVNDIVDRVFPKKSRKDIDAPAGRPAALKRVRFEGESPQKELNGQQHSNLLLPPVRFAWSMKTPVEGRPEPVWGATLTAAENGAFFRIGGEREDEIRGAFYKWEPDNGEQGVWKQEDSIEPRAWHSATLLGSRLVVFGGDMKKSRCRTQVDDVIIYDTAFSVWFPPVVTGRLAPGPRSGHCAIAVESDAALLVFGGTHGRQFLNDLFRLDAEQYEWREIHTDTSTGRPAGRAYASLTTVGTQAVLFGGNDEQKCYDDVYILQYNASEEAYSWWKPNVSGTKPKARTGHGAFEVDGKLYVFGGWDYTSSSDVVVHDDMFELDLKKFEWKKIKNIGPWPRARTGMGLAISSQRDHVLMVGGQDRNLRCTDQVYTLSL